MAKIATLVLLVLTAASILAPIDAAGAIGIAARMAKFLKKLKEPLGLSMDIIEFGTMDMDDGAVLPRRRNDAAAELVPILGVDVTVVQAGGTSFTVAGVDVTSTVTWTSRCSGGGKVVPCGDPLCDQYGECGGGGRACNSTAPAGVPLHEGSFALVGSGTKGKTIFSSDNAGYACRPNAPAGGGDYAVIGLGRGSTILPENDDTSSSRIFSYLLDGDLQGSTVWVGYDAISSENARAARANRRSTTALVPYTDSRFYYVSIAGVKVGSGEVGGREEPAALGIMTTTIPFTFLKPVLFDHLEKELSAVASPVSGGSGSDGAGLRQLCYPSGTELPTVTLLFAAAGNNAAEAEMELRPEHYSYKESNGLVCLSILPSPWTGSVSVVIGSMVQAGRRMTYKLDDNTLTFDVAASPVSSNPLRSPSPSLSSSSSVAQAKLTRFSLSVVLLLLAITM